MCNMCIYSDWESFPSDYETTRVRIQAKAKPVLAFIVGKQRQVLNVGKDLSDCLTRINRQAFYEWQVVSDELVGYEQTEEDESEIFYRSFKDGTSRQERQAVLAGFKSGRLSAAMLNRCTEKLGLKVAERMG